MMVATDCETVLQCSKTDAIDELRYRKYKKKGVSQKRVVPPVFAAHWLRNKVPLT